MQRKRKIVWRYFSRNFFLAFIANFRFNLFRKNRKCEDFAKKIMWKFREKVKWKFRGKNGIFCWLAHIVIGNNKTSNIELSEGHQSKELHKFFCAINVAAYGFRGIFFPENISYRFRIFSLHSFLWNANEIFCIFSRNVSFAGNPSRYTVILLGFTFA